MKRVSLQKERDYLAGLNENFSTDNVAAGDSGNNVVVGLERLNTMVSKLYKEFDSNWDGDISGDKRKKILKDYLGKIKLVVDRTLSEVGKL